MELHNMSLSNDADLDARQAHHRIEVAGLDLVFREVVLNDPTPTARQIAHAAGARPPDDAVVLRQLDDGDLDLVRPDEVLDLTHGTGRFIVAQADHVSLFKVDGERYEWPGGVISGAAIRRVANVPGDKAVYLQRIDQPDREILPADIVDLDRTGIEAFIAERKTWPLQVQGVTITLDTPTVIAREAIRLAGFDTAKPWQIFLKVRGEEKREIGIDDPIDLTRPGIEKLRLMPKVIDNGEAPSAPRRQFDIMAEDEAYLKRAGFNWETVIDGERRWLIIRSYPLPAGYTVPANDVALELPPTYPQAQIYGFYAYPPIMLASGREIDRSQMRGAIDGNEFHGWSRYRPGQVWDPDSDNVASHLTLVDASLAKEVGE